MKKITPEELVTAAESYDQIYSERWMTSSDELIAASEFYDQIYSGFTHLTAQDLTADMKRGKNLARLPQPVYL